MTEEHCQTCGKAWPIHQLDAKPLLLKRRPGFKGWIMRRLQLWMLINAQDEGAEFDYLEGPCCYGPGYVEAEPDPSGEVTRKQWIELGREVDNAALSFAFKP
ncbi:hypothetical protein SZ64_04275 [Erythrobacter sp. SG61-1L]|uniref:hypothetical protein n=1 Tax=Erythrobacter sp. SG61-1L TaxID=1603897 RepID=UPI0006C91D03|nr:hypothetical protein [Erythrobacter sp. SG61-1L]KPL67388.1 hypothetical protein SZ64_04275 [Erythrobacter sp. SG61-1L]